MPPRNSAWVYAQLRDDGLSNLDIADRLGVQEDSVRRALDRINYDETSQNGSNFNDTNSDDLREGNNAHNRNSSGKPALSDDFNGRVTADKVRESILSYLGTTANLGELPERSNPTKRR